MCQWIWVVDEKKRIGSAKALADWLGIVPEHILTVDDEPMPAQTAEYNWHNSCLCPFDVDATLDQARVFHRRDLDHDSMCTLAVKSFNSIKGANE